MGKVNRLLDVVPDPALEVSRAFRAEISPDDALLLEAQALVQVGAALELLPPEGQTRVVRWAISRYAVKHLRDLLGGTS